MPTSDPLIFVRYLDVLLVVLAAPFVILMGGPLLGYLVGGGAWIATRFLGVAVERYARGRSAKQQVGLNFARSDGARLDSRNYHPRGRPRRSNGKTV